LLGVDIESDIIPASRHLSLLTTRPQDPQVVHAVICKSFLQYYNTSNQQYTT